MTDEVIAEREDRQLRWQRKQLRRPDVPRNKMWTLSLMRLNGVLIVVQGLLFIWVIIAVMTADIGSM
ncbi:MAG: hypothetical protein HRU15_13140 [Planctomycetes bacterium]|nr:hypothetical protein [Planctomycetota bacterium]